MTERWKHDSWQWKEVTFVHMVKPNIDDDAFRSKNRLRFSQNYHENKMKQISLFDVYSSQSSARRYSNEVYQVVWTISAEDEWYSFNLAFRRNKDLRYSF